VNESNKNLLVRADFILGKSAGGDRPAFHRWRRVLIDALPRLLGCSERCERAERVRLHKGEGQGRFVAWLRIPVERRPGRKRLRKLRSKLRARLEGSLRPLDGTVVKLGVRRQRRRPPVLVLPQASPVPDVHPSAAADPRPTAVLALPQPSAVTDGVGPAPLWLAPSDTPAA
jgi:hypothetical protein